MSTNKILAPKNTYAESLTDNELSALGKDILTWKATGLLPMGSDATNPLITLKDAEINVIKELKLIDHSISMRLTESIIMDEIVRRFVLGHNGFDKKPSLSVGQELWYTDENTPIPEGGIVHSISLNNEGVVQSFSVDFYNEDFDEFNGSAYLTYFFNTKEDAELRYRTFHTYNEF